MALLTLACRNGFRASGFLDLAELVSGQLEAGIFKQLERSATHELSLLRAASAVYGLSNVILWEAPEASAEVCQSLVGGSMSGLMSANQKRPISCFPAQQLIVLAKSIRKAGLLNDPDLSLACGAACLIGISGLSLGSAAVQSLADIGFFVDTMALYKRIAPTPLSAEWWERTGKCGMVDVTLAQLTQVTALSTFIAMKRVKACTELPMWSEWLQVAIYVATMNQEARLSEG
eukprot:COSAG06_NODE_23356_length_694_cov_1.680672_1_plen_231_part_11